MPEPNPSPSTPTFEQWVHYCFTQGLSDFRGGGDDADYETRSQFFLSLDVSILVAYLTRLFEAPAFIAEQYTDADISSGISFIFGIGSDYLGEMRRATEIPDPQARCIRAIATIYTKLFDRVCGRRGSDPDSDLRDECAVDGAVYMIWDMDQLEGAAMFPAETPHLVEPCLEVLQIVLRQCLTSACLISALHGIGHIYAIHNYNGRREIADRLQSMIDEFLATRSLPEWVVDYALHAREGAVL